MRYILLTICLSFFSNCLYQLQYINTEDESETKWTLIEKDKKDEKKNKR